MMIQYKRHYALVLSGYGFNSDEDLSALAAKRQYTVIKNLYLTIHPTLDSGFNSFYQNFKKSLSTKPISIIITELELKFNITLDLFSSSKVNSIEVTNLAKSTFNNFIEAIDQDKQKTVTLYTWYGDSNYDNLEHFLQSMSPLYVGKLLSAEYSNLIGNPNIILNMHTIDLSSSLYNTAFTFTLYNDTPISESIDYLFGDAVTLNNTPGFNLDSATIFIGNAKSKLNRKPVKTRQYTGTLFTMLVNLAATYNFTFIVVKNKLFIYEVKTSKSTVGVHLDYEKSYTNGSNDYITGKASQTIKVYNLNYKSGLIESPVQTTSTKTSKYFTGTSNNIKVKILLNSDIKLGDIIKITIDASNEDSVFNGTYIVTTVSHSGDFFNTPWYTNITGGKIETK